LNQVLAVNTAQNRWFTRISDNRASGVSEIDFISSNMPLNGLKRYEKDFHSDHYMITAKISFDLLNQAKIPFEIRNKLILKTKNLEQNISDIILNP
jgi:hypothetical protein